MNDKANPDYYPRMKINKRWYLIVPEIDPGQHTCCAFDTGISDTEFRRNKAASYCKLCPTYDDEPEALDNWKRWDCGERNSIFVAPSKLPEYLAALVTQRMEDT